MKICVKKLNRISRPVPSAEYDRRHLENMEYFYYWGSMVTHDARCEKNAMVVKAKADSSPSNGT
jgi:hypothetical protein